MAVSIWINSSASHGLFGLGEFADIKSFDGEVGDGVASGEFTVGGFQECEKVRREGFAVGYLEAEDIRLPALQGIAEHGALTGRGDEQDAEGDCEDRQGESRWGMKHGNRMLKERIWSCALIGELGEGIMHQYWAICLGAGTTVAGKTEGVRSGSVRGGDSPGSSRWGVRRVGRIE